MEIRDFTNGNIFGVKIYSREVRTRTKVACAGGYDRTHHGFTISWISTEGVANGYQVVRFPNIDDARELAQQVNGDILTQRGSARFVKLPITVPELNFEIKWAWVNTKKLRYISPSVMERFRADYPDYVDNDRFGINPEQPVAQIPNTNNYRGFNF